MIVEHHPDWRPIKPNTLTDLWNKYSKKYLKEYCKQRGIKGAQQGIFNRVAINYLNLLLEVAIEQGKDVRIPHFGTLLARQVRHTEFRCKRYGRNFESVGGREYTIHDLMKKGNKYPVLTFRSNGNVKYRSVYWKFYIRLRVKWRKRLYEHFYDEGFEYKTMRYITPEQLKQKQNKIIWRNGVKLKLKNNGNSLR